MPNWPWYIWAVLGAAFIMFGFPLIMSILSSILGKGAGATANKQGM